MRRLFLVVVAVLLLAACTAEPQDPTVRAAVPTPTTASSQSPTDAPAGEVMAFSADTVGGATFDGGEYAGQDLMLWFWAPW